MKAVVHLLSFALLETPDKLVDPAVARRGTPHVELQEAGVVSGLRLVSPEHPALLDHGRAHPVEAVAAAAVALDGVLDVEVLRALAAHAGAELRQVALVFSLTTDGSARTKLK